MNIEETTVCMAELGHVTRLTIFRYLVKAGKNGLAVGDIQKELDIPSSTLSHHLSRLTRVGLVVQERRGTTLICFPQYDVLQGILNFLVAECCEGSQCFNTPVCCP